MNLNLFFYKCIRAEYYAKRFLEYVGDVFPVGEAPLVTPFIPRKATNFDQQFTCIVSGLKEVYTKDLTRETMVELAQSEFEATEYHENVAAIGLETFHFKTKQYAPNVFCRLHRFWNLTAETIMSEWDIPALQVQASSRENFDENGHPTSSQLPSATGRFLMETIKQQDVHNIILLLPNYTKYVLSRPDVCLSKFVGLFKFTLNMLNTIYVIITINPEYCSEKLPIVFSTERVYTLQGVQLAQPPIPPLMRDGSFPKFYFDKNRERTFALGDCKDTIIELIKSDVEFLKSNSIILYNLIIFTGRISTEIPAEEIQKSRFGLVPSDLVPDEWVLFGCVNSLWKRYGKYEQLTSLPVLFLKKAESVSITDPNFYGDRFIHMADKLLTH